MCCISSSVSVSVINSMTTIIIIIVIIRRAVWAGGHATGRRGREAAEVQGFPGYGLRLSANHFVTLR